MASQREGGIEWCDETWNPVRGCSRISPGCENCYAERVAARFSGPGQPYEGLAHYVGTDMNDMERVIGIGGAALGRDPRWTRNVRMVPEHLADPLRWKKPRRIFVNSMSDLFHEKLSDEEIAAVFGVMASSPHHTFQVLTKRAERMRDWFCWIERRAILEETDAHTECHSEALMRDAPDEIIHRRSRAAPGRPWPLPNVWLGVSVEDQRRADERIPLLLETPAAVRFISAEPLLGPVDLEHVRHQFAENSFETGSVLEGDDGFGLNAPRNALDWVIAGAESGPGARPAQLDWYRGLRDQCAAAAVPFFLKQHVERGKKLSLPVLDGHQHAEFPS